tara:strand:- start:6908 stop:9127 length:2220 start_codon:yes stop_codon:yes gene_type:complete
VFSSIIDKKTKLVSNNGFKRSWILVIASILSAIATYAAMAPSENSNKFLILILLNLDLILLISLIFVVTKRLVNIWSRKRSGQLGAQLHSRVVAMFSFLAAAPAVVLAIFGAIFFTVGIDNWFSSQVKNALNKSISVSDAYLVQTQNQIGSDSVDLAAVLNNIGLFGMNEDINIQEKNNLNKMLNTLAYERNFTEVIIFNNNGEIIAENDLAYLFKSEKRLKLLELSKSTNKTAINFSTDSNEKIVSAVSPISLLAHYFVYISRFKDLSVISDINDVKKAVNNYRGVETKKEGLHITFTMIFIVVAILLMFVAILMGLNFANGLVTPITNLANAAERVSSGDLKVRVPNIGKKDEIADLSNIFNKMTEQLENQRNDLINTNDELENRIMFTETVLTGVSAGVLGLNKNGEVFLPNKSALKLLNLDTKKIIGKNIKIVIPEMSNLFNLIKTEKLVFVKDDIEIVKKGKKLTLLTTISVEKKYNNILGYVITFDDMTEFFQVQRVAAWSDVARRIAHEIKNPLTPIQLAAERLKRKYKSHIKLEPEVFTTCINTIVRQVDGMRKMVNEFSSFARMPAPTFEKTNLNILVEELGSISILTNKNINVKIDVPKRKLYAIIDSNQIRQALLNIITNAVYSINDAKVANKRKKNTLLIKLSKQKLFYIISVTDSGLGLPNNIEDDLADPYVTTKKDGTGLGLAIVKKIMEDHQGTLELKNLVKSSGVCASLKFRSNTKVSRDNEK